MSNELEFELVESVRDGGWAVEAIDHGGDGEVARVLFTGQNSEALSREYVAWKNRELLPLRSPASDPNPPMGDPHPSGCAVCGNKVGVSHENACTKRGRIVIEGDCVDAYDASAHAAMYPGF